MKIWAKIIKIDTKIFKDYIYESNLDLTQNNLESILREICYHFDISTPILLRANYLHFLKFHTLKFFPSDFVDSVDFKYMEIESVIAEDKKKGKTRDLYSSQSPYD